MGRKKELGKGIRALLSNIENSNTPEEKNELVKELNSSILLIPIDDIETNPYQPRTEFDKTLLEELKQSIATHGLIQAITVRSLGGDKYQLISGERRLRASRMAGLEEVPAYVRVADDQAMLEMALIENIQRSNLNAIEVAISYQRLLEECQLTHQELSSRIGKNRSTITNYVRLLKLPPQIQNSIKAGELTMGHARALAGVEDLGLQLDIFKTALEKSLSVRELEDLIRSYDPDHITKKAEPKKPVLGAYDAQVKEIEKKLSAHFGTKVKINRSKNGSGSMQMKFGSDDELNSILDLLGYND